MKRLVATVALLLLLARACAPLFDAIDESACCCPVAAVVGLLLFVVYAACRLNGDIDDWYEKHHGVRRS